jgi:hypothetical protein
MDCMTSSVESEQFGLLPNPSMEEFSRMTHSAPFSKEPIWRTCAPGKACLSPRFSRVQADKVQKVTKLLEGKRSTVLGR